MHVIFLSGYLFIWNKLAGGKDVNCETFRQKKHSTDIPQIPIRLAS